MWGRLFDPARPGKPGTSYIRDLNAQSLAALLTSQNPVKNHARHKNRGKKVGQQAKGQCDRETFNRTGSEQEQDRRGNNRRDVGTICLVKMIWSFSRVPSSR